MSLDPLVASIDGIASIATFERHGDEFTMLWDMPPVKMTFSRVRETSDGMRGELSVTHGGHEIHWGQLPLASTSARETAVKKLDAMIESAPWRLMLERAVRATRDAVRQGDPIVTLTGQPSSPTRALLPPLLFESQPTEVYGDGDTGKSLLAQAISISVRSGAALPGRLKPTHTVEVAYLDWETCEDDINSRLGLLAAGLGIEPPAVLYKRMTRPLAEEATTLAAEFSRRQVGFIVIDSKMYALGRGEFHETVPAFYSALRLFAPAASLIINHVTNEDARTGRPARPFGGAFAFNGPRLIWQATRDKDITDATAISFVCTKSNNLRSRPEPFGLRFVPGEETITVYPLDLREASPQTTAGASLTWRIRIALATGAKEVKGLAEELNANPESIKKALQRGKDKVFVLLDGNRWGLAQR